MRKAMPVNDAQGNHDGAAFWCPACQSYHMIRTKPGGWQFNEDYDNPTITPSIKVTYSPTDPEHPSMICHSFVTNGQIQYCPDSTHSLAGQTIDLPSLNEDGEPILP